MGLTREQLEQRKRLITASDAAAICGVSPWKTAHDVYAEKVGLVPSWNGNYKTRRGDALEPLGVELLANELAPLTVKRAGDVTRTHAILCWLGATPDALILDASGNEVATGEIKTAGVRAAADWDDVHGEPVIPDYYLVQVQVQLTVCAVRRAHVVAMLDSEDAPRFYVVEHSPENETAILEACDDFRRHHLEPRIPPPIDGTLASARMVRALYPKPTRDFRVGDAESERLAKEYLEAQAAEKAAKERKKTAGDALCSLIGDHEGVAGQGWRALWRFQEGTTYTVTREGGRVLDVRKVGAGASKKGRAA